MGSVLLLLLLSQRLRPMPRLILLSFTEPTDMPVSHMPVMPDMPMELTHMPMVLTTERDLLMLSQRLMLTMDTTDMPDLMPMVTDHMDTQLMVTTERDLLMLSQRLMLKPRLTQLSSTPVLSQLFTPSSAPHSSLP